MESYKFNNMPNFPIEKNGKTYWISRSVAVNAIVFFEDETGQYRFLMVRRGPNVMDEPNKWCLPCGYLDWNETGYQAFIREVYEETGIYLPDCKKQYIDEEPSFVKTDPDSNRQNVSLYYVCRLSNIVETTNENSEDDGGEISEIGWFTIEELDSMEKEIAFNHNLRIDNIVFYRGIGCF